MKIKKVSQFLTNLDRPAIQIVILVALWSIIELTGISFDFIGALQKWDKDINFYTIELQNLILHKQTSLMWPLFRAFVPTLSIATSYLVHISHRHSMELLSRLFMVALVCFFYAANRRSPKTAFYTSAFFISFPVVMLYMGTYFIELPLLAFLFVSLWYWDRFLHTWTKTDFGLTVFFSVLGLLTKEAFLVHLVIMGLYAIVFFKSKRKIIVAVYVPMALFFFALYYFHYEYLFSIVKTPVVNPFNTNAFTTNFQPIGMHDIVVFFTSFRGGFIHVVINLGLAFGMTHLLVAFLWKREQPRIRVAMLLYFSLLLATLVFIAINIGTAQRYSILCFAPSYLLLIFKKITAYIHDRRLPAFCAATVVVNLLLVVIYAICQHPTS